MPRYTAEIKLTPAGDYRARIIRAGEFGPIVERERGGFPTEADARPWADEELADCLGERGRRRIAEGARAERRRSRQPEPSLQELAEAAEREGGSSTSAFYAAALGLWSRVMFQAMRRGEGEAAARRHANTLVGATKGEQLERGLDGLLDMVAEAADDTTAAETARLERLIHKRRPEPP